MALTLNCKRTGRAAVIERRDFAQMIQNARRERARRIEQAQTDFEDALSVLKKADPDWENWYDDDANIPPYICWTDRGQVDELIRRILERARAVGSRCEKIGDSDNCPVHASIVAQMETTG